MKKITIHTDGGCHGNPGPGGWAAVLSYGDHRREVSGGTPATTNNRMEIQAALEALKALKEPCTVTIYTDSSYLRSGVTSWVSGWKRNGWKTKTKQPVKNEDLWRELDAVAAKHKITWEWLKGHAGHSENERCHVLATAAIEAQKKKWSREQLRQHLEQFSASQSPSVAADSVLDLG
jgi:ribonuclease HI